MNKYDPLENHLVKSGQDVITMSFAELEAILGASLPPSALKYSVWWANEGGRPGTMHTHAVAWYRAGYRAEADRSVRRVRFIRESGPRS